MVEKAKIFYFGVFILVVFAFIFHVTAMGFSHWKKATATNVNGTVLLSGNNQVTIGLFTRCATSNISFGESCFPNVFPGNISCVLGDCSQVQSASSCSCGTLPSTKGIAACAIIASIFLGLAIIILFIHSVNTAETRTLGLVLGLFPLLLLLLAFIFILITLILIGSYLSRDMMEIVRIYNNYGKYILKTKYKNLLYISNVAFICNTILTPKTNKRKLFFKNSSFY
jgi:hypothetical protein